MDGDKELSYHQSAKMLLLFLLSPFCLMNPIQAEDREVNPLPFEVGERLEYELEWGMFNVGSAVLEVMDTSEWNGVPCWHVVFTIQSNSFADKFYKIRTVTESYISKDLKKTLFFKKDQSEGDTHREIEVYFDWTKNRAYYHNFGKLEASTAIKENTVDPLAILYVFRALTDLENLSSSIEIPLTDGKNQIESTIALEEQKTLKINAGKFKSFKAIPELDGIRGVFRKSKGSKIEMWFSEDALRYPLMIKSKVVVGSFKASLVRFTKS